MKKYILRAGIALLLMGQVIPVAEASDNQPLSLKARVQEYLSNCIWSSYYDKARTPVFAEDKGKTDIQAQEPEILEDSLALRTRLAELLEQKKQKQEATTVEHEKLEPIPVQTEKIESITLPKVIKPQLEKPLTHLVEKQVELVDQSTEIPETIDNHVLTLDYQSGTVDTVPVVPDFITDIQLQAGEKLERITMGDTEDWEVSSFLDEARNIYHVYLKPLYDDSSGNIILATDRHNYQLELVTGTEQTPIVRWYYSQEEDKPINNNQVVLAAVKPEQLNFNYQIEKKYYISWQPRHVFDDGTHTYITMDPDALKAVNPAIFTKDTQGNLLLVDYEKINDNLVIHEILENLQLHVDHVVVNIQRRKSNV